MPEGDDELARRCQKGDPRAFRLLVERYKRPLYSFIFHLVGGREATDDIFQEVFLRVYKNIGRYEPRGKMGSWLFKIANNLALDHLEKERRHRALSLDDASGGEHIGNIDVGGLGGGLAGAVADREEGPEMEAEREETGARIDSAIESLPFEQRQVFLMRGYSGLSFQEIAQTLDIPLGTALSRMAYAVRKIRSQLEDFRA